MPSNDDQYWHAVMIALAEQFERSANQDDSDVRSTIWREAAKEVRLTADEALNTNTVAERIISRNRMQ